jgi:hypothetical protein
MNLTQWRTATGQEWHSFVTTPGALFVSPGSGNYHLLSTSPAKNAGTSLLAPPVDFDELLRPAGAAIDIGAFEFGAIAGDYNRDGRVNAADYALWRKSLGSSVTRFAGADGDGSGMIDQLDFARWRANFGAVAAAGVAFASAIPEPATVVTLWIALALIRLPTARSGRFQLR